MLAELEDGAIVVEWPFKGDGVPRQGGAQGGRRRRGARARRRARGGAARPPSGCSSPAVSRRAEIVLTDAEVAAASSTSSATSPARLGRDGWPHLMPLWYVVARRRVLGVDLREVAEGPQPRARPALHAAGRGRRRVRRAARRDAARREAVVHRDARRRSPASAWRSRDRYGGRALDGRGARGDAQAGAKRVGAAVRRARRVTLGPPQARRHLLSRLRALAWTSSRA